MLGSRFILQALQQEGVDHVFMVPGGLVDHFYPDLCSLEGLTPIVAAHEGGALYMADGYARARGHFGVGLVIGGPGATNTVTALAAAMTDRTPLLLISGEVPSDWEGRGGFQDASLAGLDDIEILEHVTHYSMAVENCHVLCHHLHTALAKMMSDGKGPVHLSIPVDIQTAEITSPYRPYLNLIGTQHPLNLESAETIRGALSQGVTKVVILAGAGIEDSNASPSLRQFAETYQIPVATTLRAKGVFPEDHPLSLGVFGYSGTRQAIETILSDDLEVLLVLGSGLNQRDSLFWNQKIHPKKALIQVDISPSRISSFLNVTIPVISDCGEILKYLLKHGVSLGETQSAREKWMAAIRAKPRLYDIQNASDPVMPLHPAYVVTQLRKATPRDTVLLVDSGAHRAFCGHYWESYEPRHYLSATNLGPMGWAIPAGIGAKVARPDLPCVVVTGDGCMQMHGMEIQTAARYRIPVIYCIINNGALGNVYLRAKKMGSGPAELTEIPFHDWSTFAKSLGADGMRVDQADQLVPAIEKALKAQGPFVLDVRCGRDYTTPVTPYAEAKKSWNDL